jgi:hypothetical protein
MRRVDFSFRLFSILRLPPRRQSAFLIPSAFALGDEEVVDCVEDLRCSEEVEDETLGRLWKTKAIRGTMAL